MVRYVHLAEQSYSFEAEMRRHSGDENRVYKTVADEELLLSLYYPPNYDRAQRYPLIVFVHGGGWQTRRIFDDQTEWSGDYLGFLARRYADKGYLCASIDYRLMRAKGQTGGWQLIDLCRDCADAVGYLKAHADEIGIDTENTAVLGESAGGYLAAAMTTLPLFDTAFFKTAILVNPITDLADPRWGAYVDSESTDELLLGLSLAERQRYLSPCTHITGATCPALLLHGACDSVVLPFHALKYHDLMTACSQTARLELIEKTNHAFLLAEYMRDLGFAPAALHQAVCAIDAWLEEMGVCAKC